MATNRFAIFFATAALALLVGCKPKPVQVQQPPVQAAVSRNLTGLWEGKDKKGGIITIRFTSSGWESHIDNDGSKTPYYRGTYTFEGSSVNLIIVEEADLKTLGWAPEKGNFPKTISGKLTGGKLKVPALTEAELVRKY